MDANQETDTFAPGAKARDTHRQRLARAGGAGLIAIALAHVLLLGKDALPHLGDWLSLELWTLEHLEPFQGQRVELLAANAAFWATFGSCAIPLLILGLLVRHLLKRGVQLPRFLGWSLLGWSALAALVMQPSGFPAIMLAAIAIVIGSRSDRVSR